MIPKGSRKVRERFEKKYTYLIGSIFEVFFKEVNLGFLKNEKIFIQMNGKIV